MRTRYPILHVCLLRVLCIAPLLSVYGCDIGRPTTSDRQLATVTPLTSRGQTGIPDNKVRQPTAAATLAINVDTSHLYPTPSPSFESFKQYPGAQNIDESTTRPDLPLHFSFETNDKPDVVEAY
jgi:hypothetical protein